MTIIYSQEYFGKSSVNKRQGSCGDQDMTYKLLRRIIWKEFLVWTEDLAHKRLMEQRMAHTNSL